MPTERKNQYKWIILLYVTLIKFLVSIQWFAMPVCLQMIGSELHLSIAMLGFMWGMWMLGGLFSLPGGLLGDLLGARIVIFASTLIVAIACGLRGLATGGTFLSAMMFIAGGGTGSLIANISKTNYMWFPPAQLGLANGLFWAFTIVGAAVGAGISATIVVPAMGSWQNALFLYAVIHIFVAFGWLLVGREPEGGIPLRVPFTEAMSKTIRTKDVWLCVIGYFGYIGSFVGFIGYLPWYLQNIGWGVAASSASLTTFSLAGIVTAVLVPSLSDRFGFRKFFLMVPSFVFIVMVGVIPLFKEMTPLWVLFIIGGLAQGPCAPLFYSIMVEIKAIGAKYAGTAVGMSLTIGGLGGWIFPAIGGHLAMIDQTLPFIFFSISFLICLIPFFFIKIPESVRGLRGRDFLQ
jgi:CP family cyanate transporter-like MFS transporter